MQSMFVLSAPVYQSIGLEAGMQLVFKADSFVTTAHKRLVFALVVVNLPLGEE